MFVLTIPASHRFRVVTTAGLTVIGIRAGVAAR